jgi:hypothetical protein
LILILQSKGRGGEKKEKKEGRKEEKEPVVFG